MDKQEFHARAMLAAVSKVYIEVEFAPEAAAKCRAIADAFTKEWEKCRSSFEEQPQPKAEAPKVTRKQLSDWWTKIHRTGEMPSHWVGYFDELCRLVGAEEA